MTKKKLTAVVILGSLVMFIGATVINYFSAQEKVLEEVDRYFGYTHTSNVIYDFVEEGGTDYVSLHRSIESYNPEIALNCKPSYAYAFLDADGDLLFKSENGVWWSEYDEETNQSTMNYASLEEYMTPEIKKEIQKFKNQSGHGNILVHELGYYTDGDKKTPVTLRLGDQKGHYITLRLNDLEANEWINRENNRHLALSWRFYDIDEKSIDHIYYQKAQKQLEKEIAGHDFVTDATGGGGYISSGEMFLHDHWGGYSYFIFIRYNPFVKTVTSDFFFILTFYTVIIFAFATLIVYIVAVKLFNKSQRIRSNQRAFISAAAHELKTPLAVIQNQCECIMENIAPEKNGEYVKSVYDEALRMNSIVRTLLLFNRVTNAESILKERCDLSAIVNAEIEKYNSYAETKDAKISCDIKEGVFVSANHELISLAIDNYLSNAVKYATGEKNISVRLDATAKDFVFEAYNDGEPIPLSYDVWGILTKGDSARTSSGDSSGMGLPICKRIFELHGFGCSYGNRQSGVIFVFKGRRIK